MLLDRWLTWLKYPEAMEPDVRAISLNDLFSNKTYWIPPFQRGYAWEFQQVSDLFDDLEDFWETTTDLDAGYIMGQMIVSAADKPAVDAGYKQSLIDGQQRTTTVTLLFAAIKKRIDDIRTNPQFAGEDWENEVWAIRQMLMFQPAAGGPSKPRLSSPSAGADETIKAIVMGAAPPNPSNSSTERLIDAFDLLVARVEQLFPDEERASIRTFVQTLLNRVYVVRLVVPTTSNALEVFERINNRGLALDVADLLKNLLFRKASDADFDKISDLWLKALTELHKIKQKRIASMPYLLRAIALRGGVNIPQNAVREFWEQKVASSEITSLDLAKQLAAEAKAMVQISNGLNPDGTVCEAVAGSRHLRFVQHIPILLQAWSKGDSFYRITSEILEERVIISILSNERNSGFERYVPTAMGSLEGLPADATSDQIRSALNGSLSDNEWTELIAKAKIGVLSLTYDKASGRNRMRYVLARVTRNLQRSAGLPVPDWATLLKKQPANSKVGFHLDHVHPQSVDGGPAKVHSIGNLVMITAPFNIGLSDKLPGNAEKIQAYRDSGLLFAKSLSGEAIGDALPNGLKTVLASIRTRLGNHLVVDGDSAINAQALMSNWGDLAVMAVAETYWDLLEETFHNIPKS